MNILITHGYSDSNKGDLAITQACFLFLKEKYPEAKFILHSTFRRSDKESFEQHNRFMSKNNIEIKQGILPSPYSTSGKSLITDLLAIFRLTKEAFQLKISLLSNFLGKMIGGFQYEALKDYVNADLIVVKGGQFIYNDKEDLRGNLFLWRTLQALKTATILKKKLIILGQSFGGFASSKSEKTAIKYLSYCDKIYVREEESYLFLKKYHLDVKAEIIPDMAFYLKKLDLPISGINLPIDKKYVGLTLVNWSFTESNDVDYAKNNYIQSIIDTCIFLFKEHNLTPLFIPQVTVKHHGASDVDLVLEIYQKLKENKVESIFYKDDLSLELLMLIYKKCEFLIGTRLHSCILAANVETPILPIRYQGYKTQGVAKLLGQEDLMLDIHTITSDQLIKNANIILKNSDKIKQTIQNKTNQFLKDFEGLKSVKF